MVSFPYTVHTRVPTTMRGMDILCVCFLACVLPAHPTPITSPHTVRVLYGSPNPTVKTGIKEKFKEFLRKVVYGITPTTIYTTIDQWNFPEQYDPIRVLDWQLREEKRKGITTPSWDPEITEVTNLWDGFWNDPTIDDITFWCMRHLMANKSRPTTVKRYWESEFVNGGSIEAIAKYWKQEALKENSLWHATFITEKFIPLKDLTGIRDSEGSWQCSPNWGESHIESEDRRLATEVQRIKDEEYEKHYAKYNFNYSPRSLEKSKAKDRPTESSIHPHRQPHTQPPTEAPTVTAHPVHTSVTPVKPPRTPIVPGVMIDTESVYISRHPVKEVPKEK